MVGRFRISHARALEPELNRARSNAKQEAGRGQGSKELNEVTDQVHLE